MKKPGSHNNRVDRGYKGKQQQFLVLGRGNLLQFCPAKYSTVPKETELENGCICCCLYNLFFFRIKWYWTFSETTKKCFFSPWEGSGRNTSKLDIFFLLNFKKHCSNYTRLMDNKWELCRYSDFSPVLPSFLRKDGKRSSQVSTENWNPSTFLVD